MSLTVRFETKKRWQWPRIIRFEIHKLKKRLLVANAKRKFLRIRSYRIFS